MTTEKPATNRRRSLLAIFFFLLLVVGAASGAYYWYVGRFSEETDDAYVAANVVNVTPQVTGIVRMVKVRDTDHVQAGQPLVELDDADARIALEATEADLARTVREVRGLFAQNDTLAADVAVHHAEQAQAESQLHKAEDDYATRKSLVGSGAVGREELKHAEAALTAARASVTAAESAINAANERLAANKVLTEGLQIATHPAVARAASRVREAWLALTRCHIAAPVEGDIARRTVQVGQRVAPGTTLLSVVPLRQVWVEANFKESQLGRMRLGQPVNLEADVYGDKVTYSGKVIGFGAGTGAVFALLPAQNATGNWIKIVQRVPVRIELDPAQVAQHPLRVGLSMVVKVDTHDTSGQALAASAGTEEFSRTDIFDGQREAAEARVTAIIDAHRGRTARP